MKAWALIPARGGSKTIPYKNLLPLGGRPMLDYGVETAKASGRFERIICSSEDDRILDHALSLGIEVDRRPDHLATDDAGVLELAQDLLARLGQPPEVLALVQPTSPFVLPEHVDAVLDAFADPAIQSAQTVTPIVHNHHAWNQRLVEDGHVRFLFAEERKSAYNKQRKPKLFVFGNLLAVRSAALLDGRGWFTEPSAAIPITRPYDMDVDGPDDVDVAEALIACGRIKLPHLR